jgi:hypothetical protein
MAECVGASTARVTYTPHAATKCIDSAQGQIHPGSQNSDNLGPFQQFWQIGRRKSEFDRLYSRFKLIDVEVSEESRISRQCSLQFAF